MERVYVEDLGNIRYETAWKYQQEKHDALKEAKIAHRRSGSLEPIQQRHTFLICEHPPVYTLGKSGDLSHLLLSEKALKTAGFEFFKINRGGDITYHGPGQVVGYPILDLDCFFTDVHRYVRTIEEMVISTLRDFHIEGERVEGFTGVWVVDREKNVKRKICAIGVHLSRWVTMHGFALNVNTNISHFNHIIPCGIEAEDKVVTSMAQEIGHPIDLQTVKARLTFQFQRLFECTLTELMATIKL